MALIYHGCFTINADGTNKLISPGEKCLTPTFQCFWKDTKDVRSVVKTRSISASQLTVSTEDCKYYFKKATYRPMDFMHRKVYYKSIRSVLYYLIFTVILLYIVHNGNILTGSRNKRRQFERKHKQF